VAIGPAAQTITFGAQASQTFVPSGTFAISPLATASSGLTPTYSSLSTGVCTVSGTTVTIVTAGSCVIAADQAGNTNFSAAPQVTQTVAIGPAAQTITFGAQASQTFVPSGTFAISPLATASSGLTPTYSSLSTGVCTVSGTTVTIVTAGSCVIAADQAGNTNFSAAPQVTQTVAIGPAAQTISFSPPPPQTYAPGGTATLAATGGGSGLPVTFTSATPGVCTTSGANGATVTFVTAGTCTVTANQSGNTNYAAAVPVTLSFLINPAASTTSVASSVNPSVVGQPVTFTATIAPSAATGTVTFRDGGATIGTGTVSGGIATFTTSALTAGAHSITAVYGGSTNYSSSTSGALTQAVTANGTIALRVVADGDATFAFSSPTSGLNLSLTTSGGSAQSAAISLNAGTYNVTAALPSGFGLTSVTCSDSDSSGSVSTASASIVLSPSEAVTCTFSAVNSRKQTAQQIARFMARRNDALLSNGPDTDRQVDRLIEYDRGAQPANGAAFGSTAPSEAASRLAGAFSRFEPGRPRTRANLGPQIGHSTELDDLAEPMSGGGHVPFRFMGNTDEALQFSFSTSLAQLRRFAADAQAKKEQSVASDSSAFSGGKAPAAVYRPSAFDVWVDFKYSSFRDDRIALDNGGRFQAIFVGADLIVNRNLLVGAYVQFDDMTQNSSTSRIGGKGWMVGPYATLRLSENLFLQGRAAWGRSNNYVSPYLTYEDEFGSERWLVASSLKGRWTYGAWEIRPTATIAYIEDRSKEYIDSLGVTIPSVLATLGQAKAGTEFRYRHVTENGNAIEPRFGIEAIYNFIGGGTSVDGVDAGPNGVRGKVEAGICFQAPTGMSLDFSVAYDGIGASNFQSVTGRAVARIPLQ